MSVPREPMVLVPFQTKWERSAAAVGVDRGDPEREAAQEFRESDREREREEAAKIWAMRDEEKKKTADK